MDYHKQVDNTVFQLNGDINSTQETVSILGDTAEISGRLPIYAYIGVEKIEITSIDGGNPQLLTIVRGIGGTVNTSHLSGEDVNLYHVAENINELVEGKQDAEVGKGLSEENYTSAEKTKLSGIEVNANNYAHPSSHPIALIAGLQTALDEKLASSILTAKGDIIVRNDSGVTRLPVGSNGQILVADNSELPGIKWSALVPVFGSQFEHKKDIIPSSTSSVAYQNYTTLTTAIKPAGKYRVGFAASWGLNNAANDILIRCQVDGINVRDSLQVEPSDPGTDQTNMYSSFGYVDFPIATVHTITIDFAVTNSGNTATIRNSALEIWRVS